MTLSENIYNLVHTVDNYFIAIRALNAHGSAATKPISPHRREVFKSPLNERAAEHDVEGMTARMDATFELNYPFLLPEQKYDMVFGRNKFIANSKKIQIITS